MEEENRNKMKCLLRGTGDGYPEALTGKVYFAWKCEGASGCQKKYRLEVLNTGGREFWDTGWIHSEKAEDVLYEGEPLEADEDYIARVSVETEEGTVICSSPEYFSTGVTEKQWKAEWLQPLMAGGAAPVFRKEFTVKDRVTRGRLYLCGLGYHEGYVNGIKPGRDFLAPTWTDYRKRVSYASYDITELLRPGCNVVGVMLGNGWYGKTIGHDVDILLFTCQISLTYSDGTKEWVYTKGNDGWLVNSRGPLKQNSLYIGEVYDARDEIPDWSLPGADCGESQGWDKAVVTEPPEGKLVPQNVEEIACVQEREALSITEPESGIYVVDFGQNLAGIIELVVDEPEGTEISIRYAEILDAAGMLNTANLRTAQAKDIYISSGRRAVYRSRFTYHGFRYAEIRGVSRMPENGQIKALVLRNAVEKTGSFICSNELVNKIQTMCEWTEGGNLHGVPTDCPQRDERLGWLNDLTVRAEEAVYNYDMHRFYRKFLRDIRDAQGKKTGAITDVAPFVRYGSQPADPVCSSYLVLGWLLYQHYGDREVLKEYYDGFAAWTRFLEGMSEDGIVSYSYYGDWAAPISGNIVGSHGAGAVSMITPGKLMSTGFLYYDALLMKKMAETLGKTEDAEVWEALAEKTQKALNREYYHEDTGSYAAGSQASNTFMAWLDVSPDRRKTVDAIVKDVYAHDIHTTTGNICSRYILEVLTENGYTDLAYDIVTQTTYPSWGYMVEMGATTTWERWEYVDSGPLLGMASHNHPMYSTVSAWFYRYLLGIQVVEPGFRVFQIKPYVPSRLEWVRGSLQTVKGKIAVEWHQDGERISVVIQVPFHTECRLVVPDGYSEEWILNGEKKTGAELMLREGNYTASFTKIIKRG